MQTYFNELADAIQARLQGEEVFTASFSGEDSDFVRFNKSEVRQAGHVSQRALDLDLISGRRHAAGSTQLCGVLDLDLPRIETLLGDLRDKVSVLPEDPYLLYATDVHSSERQAESELPDQADAVARIQDAGRGRDLVGIYAAGGLYRGFANSLGQRNYFASHSYNFDWSFYHRADKAVKESYAGFRWDQAEFEKKVDWGKRKLAVLEHTPKTIEPGRYRVYLSPVALYDIVGQLGWGGFGLKAHKTKQTPLLKMVEQGVTLNPALTIRENTGEGVAPNFQEAGFIRPEAVPLIAEGRYQDCLISPRSAKEYGVETNGASAMEAPESVDVGAGQLSHDALLSELDRGVYVGNVWYLNWSDRNNCRTTGMTRFATFWVEDGEIKAPLNVMRFDETVYRMLGENLVGLTAEREMMLDADTYFRRSTTSGRLPGALVHDFTFTL